MYAYADYLYLVHIAGGLWRQDYVQPYPLTSGEWHHILITWYPDPTATRNFLYIDGVFTGLSFWSGAPAGELANAFGIGGRGFPGSGEAPSHGLIDELEVLSVGLDTPEVEAKYSQMANDKASLAPGSDTLLLVHFDSSTTADYAAGTAAPYAGSNASTTTGNQGYPFVPNP